MSDNNARGDGRAPLLMLTDVRIGGADPKPVIVRNLSNAGLMGEMDNPPKQGDPVSFDLGEIGWAKGVVVWNLGNRFGVQFANEIQPGRIASGKA